MEKSSTRDKIIEMIGNTKDDNLRAVLMVMLAVLEEIGTKIDTVMHDEERIRDMVLNGSKETHSADHRLMEDVRALYPRLMRAVVFVEGREANGGHCAFAAKRIKDEEEDEASRRKVRYSLIERLLWGAAILVALGLGLKLH